MCEGAALRSHGRGHGFENLSRLIFGSAQLCRLSERLRLISVGQRAGPSRRVHALLLVAFDRAIKGHSGTRLLGLEAEGLCPFPGVDLREC